MSARIRSKTGRRAAAAGTRSPHWWSIASRPSVFRATVLPPVFGPETTSARVPASGRSIGTAVAGSSNGWRAARRFDLLGRLHRAAVPGAREGGAGERQVEAGQGVHHGVQGLALLPHQAREHPQDALLLLGLLGRELARAVVGLHQSDGLDEDRLARARAVVDDARNGRARRRLHRQHRPAAAHRREALLQVRAQADGQVAQQVGRRSARGGQPLAHRGQLGRGGVQQAAVGVERPRERPLHAPDRGGGRLRDHRGQQRGGLLAGRDGLGRLHPHAHRGQHLGQRLRLERGVARRLVGGLTDVEGTPRAADAEIAQGHGLLGAGEARRDLRRVGRGRQREGQRAASGERGQPGEPLPDGGQLQQLGAPRVHPGDASAPLVRQGPASTGVAPRRMLHHSCTSTCTMPATGIASSAPSTPSRLAPTRTARMIHSGLSCTV